MDETRHTERKAVEEVMAMVIESGPDGMPRAIEILMNAAMRLERKAFLGAGPYERASTLVGHANGFKLKQGETRIGSLDLNIPQVRGLAEGAEGFYPNALERGLRSKKAMKLAFVEMYVQGVSTREDATITQALCGVDVSPSSVSRASQLLDAELEAWRDQPLDRIRFLMLDARYEKVRHGGAVIDVAILVTTGLRPDGKRSVLSISVSLTEAEVDWRSFMESLQARGLHGVEVIVSDDHAGPAAARFARFPSVPWQARVSVNGSQVGRYGYDGGGAGNCNRTAEYGPGDVLLASGTPDEQDLHRRQKPSGAGRPRGLPRASCVAGRTPQRLIHHRRSTRTITSPTSTATS